MRSKVISWLLEDRVEVASLGIIDSQFECKEAVSGVNVFPDSAGPDDRSRSFKRFPKTLMFSKFLMTILQAVVAK